MKNLEKLCKVHSPSGEEYRMKNFILRYISNNVGKWKVPPDLFYGHGLHDNIILKFGNPQTAIYAHVDSVGYTVRYKNELIPIGSPSAKSGTILTGRDSKGEIECILQKGENDSDLSYIFSREIDRGTSLVYKPNFRETDKMIESPYLDNRVGVWVALKIAETLQNGIITFTSYEEHSGGGADIITRLIYEKMNVSQALILDVTWITEGIKHGNGTVVSLRDSGIPRRKYIEKIIKIIDNYKLNYQFEVERSGGSDGTRIQKSSYPMDWCFIGPAENKVHSPNETIQKSDIYDTIELYKSLMDEL